MLKMRISRLVRISRHYLPYFFFIHLLRGLMFAHRGHLFYVKYDLYIKFVLPIIKCKLFELRNP